MTIAELVHDGRIELVPADAEVARTILLEAKRHLESAQVVAISDPNGAYALLYDAARKAVTAHMLAKGYRASARSGAHQSVVMYAEEALGGGDVSQLDRMRRNRNRSEYDVKVFGAAEVAADLGYARGIVAAVDAAMEVG